MNLYEHPDFVAFMAAIKARPDDDTPRLVLADWLEEHDASAWAARIREQCTSAETFRVIPMTVGQIPIYAEERRGFLSYVRTDLNTWRRYGTSILQDPRVPGLERVCLSQYRQQPRSRPGSRSHQVEMRLSSWVVLVAWLRRTWPDVRGWQPGDPVYIG